MTENRTKADGATTRNHQAKTWLTPDHVQELRNACLSEEIPTYLQEQREALLEVLYDTGLRRAELAQLDVEYLDLEGETATLYLPGAIQKRLPDGSLREDATLQLSDQSRNALRRYLQRTPLDVDPDSGPLWPSRQSDRMAPRSVNRAIKRLAEIAEVEPRTVGRESGSYEDVTAHTLRHSVAYRLIQVEDQRLEDVQMRLRHESRLVTDQLYSHLVPR